MESSKRTTERRGSLIILTLTIVLILIIVIVGICIGLFTEGDTKKIILFALLILLLFVGVGSCLFVEFQRKRALEKRDRSAELWLQQTLEEQRRTAQASAPPMSARTSWALTTPWRHGGHKGHSPGNSLPPYSPPHSDIS
ncbi:hypothetical protein ILUMI_12870 [Ignelater luminosus]|uniref:Uncharacterized protein n=1 Tax=Ignelater luminosus TaxID=2038154 RepID=A0A8K0CVL8_IGNLU|nr:hypothetical protein ILUMI_12870 [Ignelater luminosus]